VSSEERGFENETINEMIVTFSIVHSSGSIELGITTAEERIVWAVVFTKIHIKYLLGILLPSTHVLGVRNNDFAIAETIISDELEHGDEKGIMGDGGLRASSAKGVYMRAERLEDIREDRRRKVQVGVNLGHKFRLWSMGSVMSDCSVIELAHDESVDLRECKFTKRVRNSFKSFGAGSGNRVLELIEVNLAVNLRKTTKFILWRRVKSDCEV
jgi:hypothetical protein